MKQTGINSEANDFIFIDSRFLICKMVPSDITVSLVDDMHPMNSICLSVLIGKWCWRLIQCQEESVADPRSGWRWALYPISWDTRDFIDSNMQEEVGTMQRCQWH